MATCNGIVQCYIVNCSCKMFLCGDLVRCGAVLIAFISWPRFDCIFSIDTDTSAVTIVAIVAGYDGRLSPKTVPSHTKIDSLHS